MIDANADRRTVGTFIGFTVAIGIALTVMITKLTSNELIETTDISSRVNKIVNGLTYYYNIIVISLVLVALFIVITYIVHRLEDKYLKGFLHKNFYTKKVEELERDMILEEMYTNYDKDRMFLLREQVLHRKYEFENDVDGVINKYISDMIVDLDNTLQKVAVISKVRPEFLETEAFKNINKVINMVLDMLNNDEDIVILNTARLSKDDEYFTKPEYAHLTGYSIATGKPNYLDKASMVYFDILTDLEGNLDACVTKFEEDIKQ